MDLYTQPTEENPTGSKIRIDFKINYLKSHGENEDTTLVIKIKGTAQYQSIGNFKNNSCSALSLEQGMSRLQINSSATTSDKSSKSA